MIVWAADPEICGRGKDEALVVSRIIAQAVSCDIAADYADLVSGLYFSE